jgi:NifU-like protein involved in Fe-S cluster formation
MEMIKGKALEEAEKISEEDIIHFLEGIPKQKFHCTCLARRAFHMALKKYKKNRGSAVQFQRNYPATLQKN